MIPGPRYGPGTKPEQVILRELRAIRRQLVLWVGREFTYVVNEWCSKPSLQRWIIAGDVSERLVADQHRGDLLNVSHDCVGNIVRINLIARKKELLGSNRFCQIGEVRKRVK